MDLQSFSSQELHVDYVNWEGVASVRRIAPQRLVFGANQWHPEPQWLLECWDIDKQAMRTFALKDCNFRAALGGAA